MQGWTDLRDFALSLALPKVDEATSWGNPCLKAHGKLWTWWAPQKDIDAPVFKVDQAEKEFLLEHRSDIFFTTDHHGPHGLILMRPAHFDFDWARANLESVWRKQAPKRFLKEWDSEKGETS
jgi:hypothetical protein